MSRFMSLRILAVALVVLSGFPCPLFAQSTEELLANLRSPVAKTRREAAHELGQRRQKQAVEVLQGIVRADVDPAVRAASVIALGRIKEMLSVPIIVGTLKDADIDVRRNAILALVTLYVEKDIDFILARRSGFNLLNPFLTMYDSTMVDPETLVDPTILDALVKLVGRDPDEVSIPAIRALGVLHATSVVDALGQKLASASELRVEILRTLIKLGDRSAGRYLTRFLNDDDAKVRYHALTAAGVLRAKGAVQELLRIYRSNPDEKARKLAFEALALIADLGTAQVMIDALSSPAAELRRAANEGLARLQVVSEVEPISGNRLKEKDASVRLAQAFALYRLGRREYLQAIASELDSTRRDQASEYLLEMKPEDLYPLLPQGTVAERKRVVEALGKIGTQAAVPPLRGVLDASDTELVNAANLAIFRIQRRESAPTVKPATDEPDRQSRPKKVKP